MPLSLRRARKSIRKLLQKRFCVFDFANIGIVFLIINVNKEIFREEY